MRHSGVVQQDSNTSYRPDGLPGRAIQAARSWLEKPWFVSLVLFIIAFLPRVAAAGAYVTVDEEHWIARSVEFMVSLGNGDLAVVPSVHPGVTALWGFGTFLFTRFHLGGDLSSLLEMHAANQFDLPDLLPTAALFTVLVTSLTVAGGYLLLRKLAGARIAFMAALLLCLDPYLLAHSRRVHLDAILASTMFLSALALLVYVGTAGSSPRRYLVLSGALAGLAWLTKVAAIYLIPFTLLALAAHQVLVGSEGRPGRAAIWYKTKSFLLWLGTALLTLFVLWPALWVQPIDTLAQVARGLLWSVSTPHGAPAAVGEVPVHFFLGRIVSDPGPAYYPLTLLFRLSPVVLIFLPVSLAATAVAQRRGRVDRSKALAFWLGAAYPFFFMLMLSLAAKKLESYSVPVYPMVDTLAAVGLVATLRWLAHLWPRSKGKAWMVSYSTLAALAAAGILVISLLWLRLVPYYSAYFNPLLGGPGLASRVYAFGGGEGLEMAADYLNEKDGAESLVVATPYNEAVFGYYFRGDAQPPRRKNWTGSWLTADYVISYHSYTQRELPAPEVVSFLDTLHPEYVARINGTEYAQVYKVPPLVLDTAPAISHPARVLLGDQVTFLGYDLASDQVKSGGEIELTLYWQRAQPMQTDYSVSLRLLNGVQHVWGAQDSGPLQGMMPTSLWEDGAVIADVHRLGVLPGTPPGTYQIEFGMYDSATMEYLDPAGQEELLLGPVEVVRSLDGPPPQPSTPLQANLDNQVRLIGYDLGGQLQPGRGLHLTLFWEALSTPRADCTVFVHLVGPDGQIWAQQDNQPVTGYHPTGQWLEGEFVRDQYDLAIPEALAPGQYTLVVGMYQPDSGERLPVLDKRGSIQGDSITLTTLEALQP